MGSHVAVTTSYLLLCKFHKAARRYPDAETIPDPIKAVAAMLREANRGDFLRKFIRVEPPGGDNPWQYEFESDEEEGGPEPSIPGKGNKEGECA